MLFRSLTTTWITLLLAGCVSTNSSEERYSGDMVKTYSNLDIYLFNTAATHHIQLRQ